MAASAMPVLPDDGSMMRLPGERVPSLSASSISDLAMRSFTEPNGFWLSILARIRTLGFGLSWLTSTIGVLPIISSTDACTDMSWVPLPPSLAGLLIQLVGILPIQWNNRLFRYVPVHDPVAPGARCLVAQAHDHEVPCRIEPLGLGHVGRRRVCSGVGV
jgi:hypothetical protein